MRSFKERVNEINEDPKKLRRVFTFIWATAYLMLILGFILIVLVFVYAL
ncbi:MAG: hypothetical protein FWG96_03075 [Methanomassiliicoccaceae archaeon]|nr:hypothetical protein [Methanomassiliicoccaceae archaeon]